jgi:hypothetical protein
MSLAICIVFRSGWVLVRLLPTLDSKILAGLIDVLADYSVVMVTCS